LPQTGAPTQEHIDRMYSLVQSRYQGRNKRIKSVRDRRWNIVGPTIPKAFRKTVKEARLPYVRDLVKRGQAVLASAMPNPKRKPIDGAKVKDTKLSSKVERWLKASYRRMSRDEAVFEQITDALASDGEAVWKVTLRTKDWGEARRDEEKYPDDADSDKYLARAHKVWKNHFPFQWEHIDTQTFYPVRRGPDGFLETLEVSTRETYAVVDELGLSLTNGKIEPRLSDLGPVIAADPSFAEVIPSIDFTNTCQYAEYYNTTHCAYLVNGKIVKVEEHPYGEPPYFNPLFSPTSAKDPQYRTEGLADSILQLQDHVEEYTTIRMNWAQLTGFPVGRLRPVTEDAVLATEGDLKITWEQGGTVKAPDGFMWEWTPAPGTGSDLAALTEFFTMLIKDVSLAPILYGEAQGDLSGPAAQSLIAMARAIFGPAIENVGREFDRMGAFMLRLVDREIGVPVPVWERPGLTKTDKKTHPGGWIELGPDDIDGYYDVEHELAPVVQLERMAKAIWLADAQARGAVTMNYYREEGLGINDPEEMDKEVKVEQYRNSQPYTDAVLQEVFRRIPSLAQAAPMAAQQMMMPGAPPEAMPVQPGGPGVPMVAGVGQEMPGTGQMGGVMATMPTGGPPAGPQLTPARM